MFVSDLIHRAEFHVTDVDIRVTLDRQREERERERDCCGCCFVVLRPR